MWNFYHSSCEEAVWLGIGGFKFSSKRYHRVNGERKVGINKGWYLKFYFLNREYVIGKDFWRDAN